MDGAGWREIRNGKGVDVLIWTEGARERGCVGNASAVVR